MIFNPQDPFVHPPEFHWAEIYVPHAVVDFLETDIFAGEGVGDADPVVLPADATVTTDAPDFEVAG